MKKDLNPGVLVSVVLVTVALLAVIAWRMLSPPPPPADTPEARAAAKNLVDSFKNNARQAAGNAGAPGNSSIPGSSH